MCQGTIEEASATDEQLKSLAAPLLASGIGVVALTLGASGAFVAVSDDGERLTGRGGVLARATARWQPGECVRLPALPVTGELNANGAGDAFTAGFLAAMLWRAEPPLTLAQATELALASARQRVDDAATPTSVEELVA